MKQLINKFTLAKNQHAVVFPLFIILIFNFSTICTTKDVLRHKTPRNYLMLILSIEMFC